MKRQRNQYRDIFDADSLAQVSLFADCCPIESRPITLFVADTDPSSIFPVRSEIEAARREEEKVTAAFDAACEEN